MQNLKQNFTKAFMLTMLALPVSLSLPAQAATSWDVTDNYVVNMNYLGTDYAHDMNLVQDSLDNLTGNGGSPSGANVYTWVIATGTVTGTSVDFWANYTATADAVTPLTRMHVLGTIDMTDGSLSGTWSDNYQGGSQSGTWESISGNATQTEAVLHAEDFGVVDYNTGLGQLSGYTAGFGLTDATLASTTSVVVRLYGAGDQLLQTNTAIISKFNADITSTQFSSPFDVSGNFDYVTDGYWTNVRASQYGQSVPATKVVATVTLASGDVVTATNTSLTGDPTTIYPDVVVDNTAPALPTHISPVNGATVTTATLNKIDWTTVTDPSSPVVYYFESSHSNATNGNGSFTTPTYVSGTLSNSEINTAGTPEGTYYWHVRAVDNANNTTAWTAVWSVTVDNDVVVPPISPSSKNSCKKGGWKTFTNPSYKNQGQCVSTIAKNK